VRKLAGILFWAALFAALVWYANTRLPLDNPGPAVGAGPALFTPDAAPWSACTGGCGKERWEVKTLADPARARVDFTRVQDATVTELGALDPAAASLVGGWRRAPEETTVYRVEAELVTLFAEEDRDWHLVLADPANPGATMIAEIPDPACQAACSSGFASYYARARDVLLAHTNDGRLSRRRPRVRVTGVGFFDFPHGQRGAAPNHIELHPVLAIEFLP